MRVATWPARTAGISHEQVHGTTISSTAAVRPVTLHCIIVARFRDLQRFHKDTCSRGHVDKRHTVSRDTLTHSDVETGTCVDTKHIKTPADTGMHKDTRIHASAHGRGHGEKLTQTSTLTITWTDTGADTDTDTSVDASTRTQGASADEGEKTITHPKKGEVVSNTTRIPILKQRAIIRALSLESAVDLPIWANLNKTLFTYLHTESLYQHGIS